MDRGEADLGTLKSNCAIIDANLAKISANLATIEDLLADLPGKGFIVAIKATEIAMLSGVILFEDKLKAMIGL